MCRLACSPGHACEWLLKPPTNVFIYRFQGIFNANVFSELAVHTESKMIIFTSGPLQGFTFSGKLCTQLATRRPPELLSRCFCAESRLWLITAGRCGWSCQAISVTSVTLYDPRSEQIRCVKSGQSFSRLTCPYSRASHARIVPSENVQKRLFCSRTLNWLSVNISAMYWPRVDWYSADVTIECQLMYGQVLNNSRLTYQLSVGWCIGGQ